MTHLVFAKASVEERRNMERVLVGGGTTERGGYKFDGNGTVRTSADNILLGNKRDYNAKDPATVKATSPKHSFPYTAKDVTAASHVETRGRDKGEPASRTEGVSPPKNM